MMILGCTYGAGAQVQNTTERNRIRSIPEQQLPPYTHSDTLSRTIGSGALNNGNVIIYDSTTSDDRWNPYRKFTPAESAPEDPAPGLMDAQEPKNRVPNADRMHRPRK